MATSTVTCGQAAQRYAGRGWPVLVLHSIKGERCTCGNPACESPGKHPRTEHGVHDATTDRDRISGWFHQWPDSNVGIATGAASGVAVVDVDPRNGGVESLGKIECADTLTATTGGDGIHMFYESKGKIRGTKLANGIDLKADGGYVVAAPSLHKSGKRYAWVDEETDLAPLPLTLSRAHTHEHTNGHIVIEADQRTWVAEKLTRDCPQGERNNTLTELAGFFRNGMTETVTYALLTEWNANHCSPPLHDSEVRATIHGLYQRYAGVSDQPLTVWTAKSLLQATFPPLTWIVRDLLPEGLAFLAGRPKRGKSWLALQIAVDVVSGGDSLGVTTRGKVIYLALEDSPRRIQSRLQQMRASESDDLIFLNTFPQLDNGGRSQLVDLIGEWRPVLVVVDTLARVMGGKRDQDSAGDMTDLLAPIQALALDAHCCILFVDHHRKPGVDVADMIDDIAGSTAKTAVADAILGLYRKSGEQSAQIKMTGRDIEERELGVTWDALRFRWKMNGEAALTAKNQRIIDFVAQVGEADIHAIAAELGITARAIQEEIDDLIGRRLLGRTTIPTGSRGRPRILYLPAGKT